MNAAPSMASKQNEHQGPVDSARQSAGQADEPATTGRKAMVCKANAESERHLPAARRVKPVRKHESLVAFAILLGGWRDCRPTVGPHEDAGTHSDGGTDASTPDASDASSDGKYGSDADATIADAGSDATGASESGSGCLISDAGIGGIAVPVGTVATASGYYSTDTPNLAIDGNIATGWNAGGYTGWIELTFPAPVTLDGIQLAVAPSPTATETFTVTGFEGSTSLSIGSWTETIEGNIGPVVVPPMVFAASAYDAIRIEINGGASWVTANEISVLTPRCPAASGPDSGPVDGGPELDSAPSTDAGGPAEAGEPDASAPDGTTPDAGAPFDASWDGAQNAACTLGPAAPTPFPPIFGSAELAGTLGVAVVPTMCGNQAVTSPTSGSLTFAISPTTCSFEFVDANGQTYTSNIGSAAFDGDTYFCSYTGFANAPGLYSACPDLIAHADGLSASMSLAVTRSTGAVTLSRDCAWNDACVEPGFLAGSELVLSGSLSCVDAGDKVLTCGTTTCSAPSQIRCTYAPPLPLGPTTGCFQAGTMCVGGTVSACSGPESCPSGFVCCPSSPLTLPNTVPVCYAGACPPATSAF